MFTLPLFISFMLFDPIKGGLFQQQLHVTNMLQMCHNITHKYIYYKIFYSAFNNK